METKGVASVRSPVRNLQHFNTGVTHEGFVDAVIREFREEYPVALDSEVDKASFFFLLSRSIPLSPVACLRRLWMF